MATRTRSKPRHATYQIDPNLERFLATVRKRFAFSKTEFEMLSEKMTTAADFEAGEVMVEEGERATHSSLLLEGYAARSKYTADGARQIMEFQIPGDFIDLHSYPLECLDHSITAISDCTIVQLKHQDISELIAKNPRFARIFWFATMADASIHREWILNLGSRSGVERVAHLLCEMYCRSEIVGLTDNHSFQFPVTQAQIGEALGFSAVHIGRLMRELRDSGLVTFQRKVIHLHDWPALQELAGFDPDYLYLQPRKG